MCKQCNQPHPYKKDTPYKDMWFHWEDDGSIHILCPNTAACIFPGEVLKVEQPNPARLEIPFGKYAGETLQDLKNNKWYLDFLYGAATEMPKPNQPDKRNALMAACIDVMLNRYNPEDYV